MPQTSVQQIELQGVETLCGGTASLQRRMAVAAEPLLGNLARSAEPLT